MIVKTEETVTCKDCGELIILREYVGMEGGWYTDHHCEVSIIPLQGNDK